MDHVLLPDSGTVPILFPLEHHHPVQGGKLYEIADHDKYTVTTERPTTSTTHSKEVLKTKLEADSLSDLF